MKFMHVKYDDRMTIMENTDFWNVERRTTWKAWKLLKNVSICPWTRLVRRLYTLIQGMPQNTVLVRKDQN